MWNSLVEALRRAVAELNAKHDSPLFDSPYETRAGLSTYLNAAADSLARGNTEPLDKVRRICAPTSDWDDAGAIVNLRTDSPRSCGKDQAAAHLSLPGALAFCSAIAL